MKKFTKPLALFLALVMIVGLLPMTAFAEDDNSVVVRDIAPTSDDTPTGILAVAGVQLESSGNVLTIKTNAKDFNIHAIAIDRGEPEDFVALENVPEGAVQVQGAKFENGVIGNLNPEGAYATIDLDLVFADKSIEAGEHTIYFQYDTLAEDVVLTVTPSYRDVAHDDNNGTTPATEGTTPATVGTTPATVGTTPATEGTTPATVGTSLFTAPHMTAPNSNGVMPLADGSGYKKVTVTDIAATGDWDATDMTYQNWFVVPNVRLDPNGTLTIKGNAGKGINISAIGINGTQKTVTDLQSAITISGRQNGDQVLEDKNGQKQIAWLDNGLVAQINLSAFNLPETKAYNIALTYAIEANPADLIIESSAGNGETSVAYSEISHGAPGSSGSGGSFVGTCKATDPRVTMSDTGSQSNPGDKAIWFFESKGEKKSFNTENDTYEDELKVNAHNQNNGLIMYASADGCIRNTTSAGEFWINWENQYRSNQQDVGSTTLMKTGYTDGSYTVVGWGGDFQPSKAKQAIQFKLKDGGDGTLADALSHLTIYLVDKDGKIEDKVWAKTAAGNGTEKDDLHYVNSTADGYYIFEATLNGSENIQGIKLAFDRYSSAMGSNENTHHSGTLVIAEVNIKIDGSWKDFGPFNYYAEDSNYENPYKSPVKPGYRPFLRSSHYLTSLNPGAKAGYNLANKQDGFGWHWWTMSTSDANIVNSDHSGKVDALQIKYSNTKVDSKDLHVTYTHLVGTKPITGEWLAITLGGEVDANTKFQLVNSSQPSSDTVVKTLSLSDFTTDKVVGSTNTVSASTFNDNQYHTIYYYLGGGDSFRSVYVDVSGTADTIGDASRYMYISEIYLLPAPAEITKAVDKTEADPGQDLTYTLTVKNTGDSAIGSFVVEDVLPEHVTYNGNTSGLSYANGKVTWNWSGSLSAGASASVQVAVKIDSDCPAGTLKNSAVITKLDNQDRTLTSNVVTTDIRNSTLDEYVFYAEVGQKTTLPIHLGQTIPETTMTGEVTKDVGSIVLTSGTNFGNSDYLTATAQVSLSSPGKIQITTTANGGISIREIKVDGTQALWMDNKQTQTASNVTISGSVVYFDSKGEFAEGEISNLQNGAIEISDLSAGSHTIAVMYRSWGSPALDLKTITTETTTTSGDPVDDKFMSVPTSSTLGATIDANGAVGQNSANLLYTSTQTGKDTFTVTVSQENKENKNVTVTVYNYQVKDHVYVLDYGLPVDLTDTSKGYGLLQDATLTVDGADTGYAFNGLSKLKRNGDGAADSNDYTTPYGDTSLTLNNGTAAYTAATESEALKVTFTPTAFMSDVDTFYYGVQVSKNGTAASDATNATPVMEGQIKVMPANVVYYEDNFSKSGTSEADGTNGIIYTGASSVGNTEDRFQWQTNDQDSPYGYDEEAYKNAINQYSNGNAHELAINSTASFTFKGTGFDIIGRTNNKTGIIMAMIYSVDENNTETFHKFIVVDTYYENGDLYQIPVISVLDLTYGTYKVVLYSMRGYADEYAGQTSTVYIDGVRIYNPLDVEGNEGYLEEEQGAQFMEVKSMIFGSNFNYDRNEPQKSTWTGGEPKDVMATLIKYNQTNEQYLNGSTLVEVLKDRNNAGEAVETAPSGTYDLLTYAFSGPNNELYLENGYGFGFVPEKNDDSEPATLQIGVKLISKAANASAYPWIEYLDAYGEWQQLCVVNSSTEKYYSLDELLADQEGNLYCGHVVLRVNDNNSGAIVSVTNIKYKNYKFYELTTEDKGTETIQLNPDAISAKAGYNSKTKKFKASSITLAVKTNTDIREVIVYSDENGSTQMTLLSMTYKDKNDVRTWTVKFKGLNVQQNYWVQIVDEYGHVSNLAKVGA